MTEKATLQQLMAQITERAKQLDGFPRLNRHCAEWFDKYNGKHTELLNKFESHKETEKGIINLLAELDLQKQQQLERNFKKLNENFIDIFTRVVPQGLAEMRLVKKDRANESQISNPSQFEEASQVVKIG